jgi:tetratricopeptide (TPR) repeat protein
LKSAYSLLARLVLPVGLFFLLAGGLVWWQSLPGEWQRLTPEVLPPHLLKASQFPPAEALACRTCHEEEFKEWETSQHAHANRLVSFRQDAPAFNPRRSFREGLLDTTVFQDWRDFVMRQIGPDGLESLHQAVAVIGIEPLIQYLTPFPGGRLQVFNPAYDPARGDWFDVFAGEDRQAHEWGFWKNQGMNWNSQCAACHMTSFEKNFDFMANRYSSTWQAMGISCTQCHGEMPGHAENPDAPVSMSESQVFSNCISCHSRREELTGAFRPGEDYHDHYQLTLPDLTDIYFADGQVRDENFEAASFLGSKMGHAGVSCLDCHHAHSAKLRLPVENNAMCMSCHPPPGTDGAVPIPDPVAHSHHGAQSTGNRCVECHMPETTYMARDPRRDHGFTIPDPQLTLEFGIPNACNLCHTDQTAEWAAEWVANWYGEKINRPERERARLIMGARTGDAAVTEPLVAFYEREPNDAWKASLLLVLDGRQRHPSVAALLERATRDASPLVRKAALQTLESSRPDLLRGALDDPAGVVRIPATRALLFGGETVPLAARAELERYLNHLSDNPSGALQQARLAAVDGRSPGVDFWLGRALELDSSAGMQQEAALLQYSRGQLDEAAVFFSKAIESDPVNADLLYSAALLEAELQRPDRALDLLRRTVKAAPAFGRAWYNLGLAEAANNNLQDSVQSLENASALLPESPEPPYALATVFLRLNQPPAAKEAAREALKRNPTFAPAQQILRSNPASSTPPGR